MAVINGRGTWGVRALVPTVISTSSVWTRPADWLALNAPTNSTEQFTGLLAITNDDGNYVTIAANSTGNYTVDWGDGTVTTHASATIAEKKYDYSAISDTTLSSRGYKQVVVKLTGTNITTLYTNRPHSALASATNVLNTWLEYHINLPNCTSIVSNRAGWPNGAFQTWVEKVTINKLGNITSFAAIFNAFYALQEVVINATTTSVTNTSTMFQSCYYLKSVPLFDTSNVVTTNNMFESCYSLETIPSFNFGSVTSGAAMFIHCYALTSVPALNFGNATTLSGLFTNCHNLTTIGGLTTTKCTDFTFMFTTCYALETVPLFDTSKALYFGNMFQNCYELIEIPAFNTVSLINMANTFNACYNLKTIPLLDTSKVTNFTGAFANCPSLDEMPALSLSSTTISGLFSNGGITRAPFVDIKNSFTFSNQMLSRAAIVEIFNGLASGVTGKTITVSLNPGHGSLTAADRLIATAKGWTIA